MNQELLDIANKIFEITHEIEAIALPASEGRTLPSDGEEMRRLCAELQQQIEAYITLDKTRAIPVSQGRTLPSDGAEIKRLSEELQQKIDAYIALEAEEKNA